MAPPEGTSAENEGSRKVKKKNKKKENLCGFKMRFNSKWLGDLAEHLSPAKQGIIRNGPFGDLLDIKLFKIIYMDHLDIPPDLPNEHVIDYFVPRIRYVCQKDFDSVDKVDKNKLTLVQPFYGVDPEAATGQGVGAEAANGRGGQNEAPEAQENVEVQPNLSSSFDDWLQQPFPGMDDLREIFSTEVDDALGKFGQSLKGLQSNRMAAMLCDVGDAIANTMDEAREKEKDAQDEVEAATPTMDEACEK
ncbi:Cytokinin-O-glucosyltransferase 2 [Hordeum vulgare]|nr:Cytokinin-O-glucosyltransferase 2 [Hordeum vulgare]